MFNNIGWLDRAGRIILGVVLLALVVAGPHAWWGLVGMLPLVSAFRGNCPVYSVIGVSTRRRAPEHAGREILGLSGEDR